MRKYGWIGVVGVLAGALILARCVGDSSPPDGDASADQTTNDAPAGDAGTDAPPQDFTVTLQPSHLTFDRGDAPATVQITITRAPGFNDDVSFSIAAPSGITASAPLDTGTGGSSSSFTVTLDADAGAGVTGELSPPLTVTAQNPGKSFVVNAQLGIRVGSLLPISDGGVTIPSYASSVIVKVWGAGGGASCPSCSGNLSGAANGGGGGFASATLAVAPGSTLVIVPGTGGLAGHGESSADAGCGASVGGSGGGFSAVQDSKNAYLVIAGGGGGAAYGEVGAGAGGGLNGQNDLSPCGGRGGTQTQGGGSADAGCTYVGASGAAYQGGNAENQSVCVVPSNDGGSPGGGNGAASYFGFGLGGGGGGYFGGAGGGEGTFNNQYSTGGGGGGSGWIAGDAGTLKAGALNMPASNGDADFSLCPAGAAAGGVPGTNGGNGGPGCVLVRLTKP